MTAQIIDGKAFAATVREKVAGHVARLKEEHGITPGLAVVLVGEDPASQVYVRSKGKQTVEAGMNSYEHKLDVDTSEEDLLALIDKLNNDPAVHGILVQLPLPGHLNEDLVINSIAGQGCGRLPYFECWFAGHGAEKHGALHAAWLSDDAARSSRKPVGFGCGCDRAFKHRGQAHGPASAWR